MIRRQVVITSLALALCGAFTLTGCTADANSALSETPTSAGSITDEVTCDAFGDVSTITANADSGLRDGRMEDQEQQGWYRLATRVLDRVPTSGAGAVNDAVTAMKEAAPTIKQGAMTATGIRSAEWESGRQALVAACAEAGFELSAEMYTGG